MNPDEQMRFLDSRCPRFKQMWSAEQDDAREAQAFVEKSLADMRSGTGIVARRGARREREEIIDQGSSPFTARQRDVKNGRRAADRAVAEKSAGRAMKTRGAFTLVELLVVIAIIAVLAVLAYPAYQRVIQSGRRRVARPTAAARAALAVYLGENNNTMPTRKLAAFACGRRAVIDNTLDSTRRQERLCLSPRISRVSHAHGTSYVWNVTLNGQALAT